MKALCVSIFGVLALGASLSALAGPDWQAIEQARKAKQNHAATKLTQPTVGPEQTVLPLDHGPRAQSTPWLNRQRMQGVDSEASDTAKTASTLANK